MKLINYNISVHRIGVQLRFTATGDFVVHGDWRRRESRR
jgi:hypothetical protein